MDAIRRRSFLKLLGVAGTGVALDALVVGVDSKRTYAAKDSYAAARIVNEYSTFLPGEREALAKAPAITYADGTGVQLREGNRGKVKVGERIDGWHLLTVLELNGTSTAVFEKHVTHRGAIAFVTASQGTIGLIPKGIGDLAKALVCKTGIHGFKSDSVLHISKNVYDSPR